VLSASWPGVAAAITAYANGGGPVGRASDGTLLC
jgi:hypothetical protein